MIVEDGVIQTVANKDGLDISNHSFSDVYDLKQNYLLPSFTDAHMHLSLYTLLYSAINLRDCQSIKEVQDKLKKGIGRELIVGWGFDHEQFQEGRMPTRKDLDSISSEIPIFILRFDEHIGVVNSEVLRRLGINQNIISPEGGKIGRFSDGQPNGILVDKALPTEEILNNSRTKSSMQQNLLKVQKEFFCQGLTSVSDMGINFETLDFYRDMEEKGYLKIRVHVYLNEACLKEKKRIEKEMSKNGRGLVQVCGLKLFVDGSFGASSGALYEPYINEPKNYGLIRILPKKLNNIAKQADEIGMQLSIHVIGDRALTYALDALSYTRNKFLRHRVEHIQLVNEEHLKRMKQQQVIAAIQPIFVSTDYPWAEKRLGRERIQKAYPLKRVVEKGIRVAGSSDCPVASADPFLGIYFAVSHKDLEGKELPDWVKKERIGIKEALKIFTEGASYALNEKKGQIKQDMQADFIILSENPLRLPIQKIPSLRISQTYIGGQLV
ncbi:MAG TPA: amidohydrolase [Atribacterota bacterium]|nr:amidohydrolase [Atribacterota bacterium]